MLAYLFVIVAVALRFLPHPLAFTPVGAALLFFGARMPRRHFAAPLAMLFASDVILTRFIYGYPFAADHYVTWAWYAAILFFGSALGAQPKALRLGGAALATSVSFFLVSNFAVWAVWHMYPKTLAGLAASYIAALPFFRNALAGDLFFTAVFFSVPVFIQAMSRPRRHRVAAA